MKFWFLDPQQPVAESSSWWLHGVILHAAPGLPSVRHLLLPLSPRGRLSSWPRLRWLPRPAEPVQPRLPQQLLRRRLSPHTGRQQPPCLRGQAGVREALVQHRCAAHEGQGARGQHILGHVIRTSFCICVSGEAGYQMFLELPVSWRG